MAQHEKSHVLNRVAKEAEDTWATSITPITSRRHQKLYKTQDEGIHFKESYGSRWSHKWNSDSYTLQSRTGCGSEPVLSPAGAKPSKATSKAGWTSTSEIGQRVPCQAEAGSQWNPARPQLEGLWKGFEALSNEEDFEGEPQYDRGDGGVTGNFRPWKQ